MFIIKIEVIIIEIYLIYLIVFIWVIYRIKVIQSSKIIVNPDTRTTEQKIGDIGELKVARELEKLDKSYIVENSIDTSIGIRINNLQIDHIVKHMDSRKIFVIETKNWAGRISGRKHDTYWKQINNDETHWYGNPIKQNLAHCKVIRNIYPKYTIVSIVVFVNMKCELVNKSTEVIKLNQLLNYINNHVKI